MTLSDFRKDGDFGESYGVMIKDGALRGLLTRSIFVIDKEGKIAYVELVPEITNEPNYAAAIEAAKKCLPTGTKLRTDYTDGDPDKEAGFYILKHTKMPTVLTESLFQDNKDEVDFLLSEEGKQAITNLHVQGIIKYLSNNE